MNEEKSSGQHNNTHKAGDHQGQNIDTMTHLSRCNRDRDWLTTIQLSQQTP